MKNNINDIENLGRVNAVPAGRGLLSFLISTGVIGTGQGAIVDKFVRDNNVDTVAEEPIRQKLLERMEQKGIKLLTPKDLSNGNPEIEKQLQTMENAFYHPGKKVYSLVTILNAMLFLHMKWDMQKIQLYSLSLIL